LQAIKSVGSIL
jgi:vacuolar-type H+-ATPase subunit F/Vma7